MHDHIVDVMLSILVLICELLFTQNPPPGRLVFVTTQRIRAEGELRIDYNPGLKELGKGKRQKRSQNADGAGSMNLKMLSKNSLVRPSPSGLGDSASAHVKGRRIVDSDDEMTLDGTERPRDMDLKMDEVRCECDSGNCRVYIKA